MKVKTYYSNNPRFIRTKLYLNDAGGRDAISVNSRINGLESETLYVYKRGKREIAHRIEKGKEKTTEYFYPIFTGKPLEIREEYHPQGKLISISVYDENWNEIDFKWAD